MAKCKFCDNETAGMQITVVGTGTARVCDDCLGYFEPACRQWQVNKALTDGVPAMPKIKFDKAP